MPLSSDSNARENGPTARSELYVLREVIYEAFHHSFFVFSQTNCLAESICVHNTFSTPVSGCAPQYDYSLAIVDELHKAMCAVVRLSLGCVFIDTSAWRLHYAQPRHIFYQTTATGLFFVLIRQNKKDHRADYVQRSLHCYFGGKRNRIKLCHTCHEGRSDA